MDWIDEVYEWCGDGMEQNGRYTRAFLTGFFRAVGAAGYYADSGLIGSAKGKRYSEEYNDAAIAFELDIDEVERRHETPDPDFPDFVADLPEDADVERDLDSMWKEYCARSNSKRFSSFYMKRNAYQRAYPATNSAEGLGAASGLLFSAYFYFIPSIAMAGLDFANEWLKDPSEYHES